MESEIMKLEMTVHTSSKSLRKRIHIGNVHKEEIFNVLNRMFERIAGEITEMYEEENENGN